jgi:hypothetical protein
VENRDPPNVVLLLFLWVITFIRVKCRFKCFGNISPAGNIRNGNHLRGGSLEEGEASRRLIHFREYGLRTGGWWNGLRIIRLEDWRLVDRTQDHTL